MGHRVVLPFAFAGLEVDFLPWTSLQQPLVLERKIDNSAKVSLVL